VFRYDDEEWASLVADPASSWSRPETDYLLDMVERFDQRFVVIADRWDVSGADWRRPGAAGLRRRRGGRGGAPFGDRGGGSALV
jgi:hypothetical protein